ncbi:prepilin peptidase [Candidatus Uhrbacteria bacterium]|nr:prepilin peptidase [Candidatus Uhrbacteria bacterium]
MHMFSIIIFLFGLCIGSFLNVVILRIPAGQSVRGRSRCFSCARTLRWFELVPLFSYAVLRGKCRSCRAGISLQYPLVELVTALLFLLTFFHHRVTDPSLGDGQFWELVIGNWIFVSALVVLFVQDLRFQILPDVITLPAIAIAMIFWFFDSYNLQPITYNLLATAIGGGFFLLQWLVSRGRWVGGGDIRLGALMGAILGWPNILLALFLAYVSGAIVGGTLLLARRVTGKSQIAFGTFLTASTIFTMFWGDRIVTWYAKIIGL